MTPLPDMPDMGEGLANLASLASIATDMQQTARKWGAAALLCPREDDQEDAS